MVAGEENAPRSLPPSLSERVERSVVGRTLISAAVVLLLLAQVATHLPTGSALHRSVEGRANAAVRLLASEQQWGVFAPDPRSTSLRIEGHVTFADGTTAVWELPEGARIGSNLRYYRWRKWLERVRSDDFRGLWEPTARWIASQYDDRPSPVVKVELVRLFHKNTLQGEPLPYQSAVYFTFEPDGDEEGS